MRAGPGRAGLAEHAAAGQGGEQQGERLPDGARPAHWMLAGTQRSSKLCGAAVATLLPFTAFHRLSF